MACRDPDFCGNVSEKSIYLVTDFFEDDHEHTRIAGKVLSNGIDRYNFMIVLHYQESVVCPIIGQ